MDLLVVDTSFDRQNGHASGGEVTELPGTASVPIDDDLEQGFDERLPLMSGAEDSGKR